jgi:caffeoyl-CoA O-methyltransferase
LSDNYDYEKIQDYLTGLVPERPDEMQIMERYAQEHQFPIIGPVVGYYCYQVARMTGARSVFEMGSGYGYSTAWFAKAVKETCEEQPGTAGVVHHVVWDQTLSDKARIHLRNLDLDKSVQFHVAEAVQALRSTNQQFDLIFCDIDKDDYPAALDVINEKTHSGSVLVIDNMLWHGHIFNPGDHTANTAGVREFTRKIKESPDWIVSLAPLRDGVIVAYKKDRRWAHQS